MTGRLDAIDSSRAPASENGLISRECETRPETCIGLSGPTPENLETMTRGSVWAPEMTLLVLGMLNTVGKPSDGHADQREGAQTEDGDRIAAGRRRRCSTETRRYHKSTSDLQSPCPWRSSRGTPASKASQVRGDCEQTGVFAWHIGLVISQVSRIKHSSEVEPKVPLQLWNFPAVTGRDFVNLNASFQASSLAAVTGRELVNLNASPFAAVMGIPRGRDSENQIQNVPRSAAVTGIPRGRDSPIQKGALDANVVAILPPNNP
ncbi:hypothetical protein Bbelb_050270 [Branchiostoma belcheri]|nr:hypothetical protein Bbelb_050270 [Branchiostoma belcheri]